MANSIHKIPTLSWMLIGFISLLTLIPGCNVITPVAYAIHGPQKIDPVYTLTEELKTVVFVDDPSSRVTQRRLRYSIADRATKELLAKRILVDMLDPRGILTAASSERYGELSSIADLGKSVGADIVIYAVVTEFSLTPETGSYIPQAMLRVKIIDVASGERIWPDDEMGHVANIQMPQRAGAAAQKSGDRIETEQELAQRAGLGLAQLFYKHEITETVLFGR
ncbi:MAG: hypothetical protein P1U42_01925 [Phycisphaerales bacterium]|nr:hypothetical protein [Phycisphaerales bacterium]